MNGGNSIDVAAASHSVPNYIEIPHVRTKSAAQHQELTLQSSSVYLNSRKESSSSCSRSDPTLQDLEDMKRMVRELRNKSVEEVYQKWGLGSEGDATNCVRQVSIDDVDK